MDRAGLADIVYLVSDLDGYVGVYETPRVVAVVLSDDRSRIRAAARLTALPPMHVEIVGDRTVFGRATRVDFSDEELRAAASRDRRRREAWAKERPLVIEGREGEHERLVWGQRERTVLVVSATAARYADELRTLADVPITTRSIDHLELVIGALAKHPLPSVIVFDVSLSGVFDVCRRVRELYPHHFSAIERVQWIGSEGLAEEDVTNILTAIGTRARRGSPAAIAQPRVLVVGVQHELADEVRRALPQASVDVVDGWTALERLDAEKYDLVIASDAGEVGLPALVRFVREREPAPAIVVANEAPASQRMRDKVPHIAHYFVDRPIAPEDLRRVLRMT